MKYLILALLISASNLSSGQTRQSDSIYTNPQVPAKFLYSPEEQSAFISSNLIVPESARYYGINGDVTLTYVIDTLGDVVDGWMVTENLDFGNVLDLQEEVSEKELKGYFSNEALRVANLMSGLFEPAMDQGRKVTTAQNITLLFRTKQYEDNERDFRVQKNSQTDYRMVKFNFGTYTKEEPDYSLDRYNHGVKKMQEGKLDMSCIYFEEAVRMNPQNVDALYDLGIVYLKLSKTNEACLAWDLARQLGDNEARYLMEKYCINKK
jgi:tetratricopeptide (TPR) repeat protein